MNGISYLYDCPRCLGTGIEKSRIDEGIFGVGNCSVCNGESFMSETQMQRFESGERRRLDRIRKGISLAEEAARLGISANELRDREHGRYANE